MEGSGRRGMSRVSGAPEEKRNAKKKPRFILILFHSIYSLRCFLFALFL